jgi:hypothetical protein
MLTMPRLRPFRVDLRAHPLDLPQIGLGMAQEDLACRGELDAAGMALEQRHAEIFLQFLNLATERGLGNVQLLGRLANRSVPCNRGEIAQRLVDHFMGSRCPETDAEPASLQRRNCACPISGRRAQFAAGRLLRSSRGTSHARHGG